MDANPALKCSSFGLMHRGVLHTAVRPMALTGDLLACVCQFLSAEDLLHASRVCRTWCSVVQGEECEPTWHALCNRYGYTCSPGRGPARLQFKRRHEQVLKDRRLKRRVDLMTVRSRVANLERELQQMRQQRQTEQQSNRRARGEAASAARLAQAQAAMQGWQIGIVQAHHERLLQPAPIQGEWRMRNLEQTIKESDVHLRTLERSIRTKEGQLSAERRRLAAMTGS